jgi:hypothetical protein
MKSNKKNWLSPEGWAICFQGIGWAMLICGLFLPWDIHVSHYFQTSQNEPNYNPFIIIFIILVPINLLLKRRFANPFAGISGLIFLIYYSYRTIQTFSVSFPGNDDDLIFPLPSLFLFIIGFSLILIGSLYGLKTFYRRFKKKKGFDKVNILLSEGIDYSGLLIIIVLAGFFLAIQYDITIINPTPDSETWINNYHNYLLGLIFIWLPLSSIIYYLLIRKSINSYIPNKNALLVFGGSLVVMGCIFFTTNYIVFVGASCCSEQIGVGAGMIIYSFYLISNGVYLIIWSLLFRKKITMRPPP